MRELARAEARCQGIEKGDKWDQDARCEIHKESIKVKRILKRRGKSGQDSEAFVRNAKPYATVAQCPQSTIC